MNFQNLVKMMISQILAKKFQSKKFWPKISQIQPKSGIFLFSVRAAIMMVLSQDMGLFPIIHGRKNLGNHSRGIR